MAVLGGGRDDGAEVLGELDDGRAEAAGSGVDEHLLTGLQVCAVDEDLPGGQGDQRYGGGFLECERVRLGRDVVLVDRDEFGERADPEVARTGVDLVTDLEVAHVGADLGDHAGHVVAEHEGRLALDQPLELAVAGHLVQRVDARGAHPDEDVASSDGRLGHVGGARTVLAVLLDDECLHDGGPLRVGECQAARKSSASGTNSAWYWKMPPWPASG